MGSRGYTNNYNFTLTEDSPCIDSGINSLIIGKEILIDMDSSEDSGIMADMGYFEYYEILYGDVNLKLLIDIVKLIFIEEKMI